jgi:RND superfamily putative drug exporter
MRRPVLVVLGTTAVLATLAMPVRHIQFGGFDERVLPAGTESRVVSERIKADFPHGSVDHILVLVSGADQAAAAKFATDISHLTHVTGAAVIKHSNNTTPAA